MNITACKLAFLAFRYIGSLQVGRSITRKHRSSFLLLEKDDQLLQAREGKNPICLWKIRRCLLKQYQSMLSKLWPPAELL